MSSPSPSKSRFARMGGALRRTSTLLLADDAKATPTTPPARDTSPTPSKAQAPAAISTPVSPPKRGVSQGSVIEETAASPAKSRLARLGGTLRRNSSLLSGKAPAAPSVTPSERDSESTSSKGSAVAPASIASHKRGVSQGSVDGSATEETVVTPSKSPLARIGGVLRRSSSRTSLKGNGVAPSVPASKHDVDSASAKGATAAPVPIAPPKRSASQASLVDESTAGGGGATPSKSKLARIGGIVRRNSSRLSVTRPRTPSITSSDRDAVSTSVKGAAAAPVASSMSSQTSLAEPSAQETSASQDAASAGDPPTPAPVAISVEPESLPRDVGPLSPVQENPLSPVFDSAGAGPGGITDESQELPQPQVTREFSLSLSQMEWVDEPESMSESVAPAIIPLIAAAEASEPIPGQSAPEPTTALSAAAAAVPPTEDPVQVEPLDDAIMTPPTVASENVVDEDASTAHALAPAEPVLLGDSLPIPRVMSPEHAKPEVATPALEPAVPSPAASAASATSHVPSPDSKSGVPATTTPNVPPSGSGVTWTLGSILAEGISILLRLVWQIRRAGRT